MPPVSAVKHVILNVYPSSPGGNPRLGVDLLDSTPREIVELSPAANNYSTRDGVQVQAVAVDPKDVDKAWARWSGARNGILVHDAAFTSDGQDRLALEYMFAGDPAEADLPSIGSLDRVIDHSVRNDPGAEVENRIIAGFRGPLMEIPRGAILNWQMYMFEGMANAFADQLRERGVLQTYHVHEPLPATLHLSPWGRDYLKALSKMDVVYVHTDTFAANLTAQLDQLGLRKPMIARFDLAIGQAAIARSLSSITAQNYETTVPDFAALTERQQDFVREVFRSGARGEHGPTRVPHRFMAADRFMPFKGTVALLEGIHSFLQAESARGVSRNELEKKFRFFVLEDVTEYTEKGGARWKDRWNGDVDLYARYMEYARDRLNRLCQDWPGIVWAAEHFNGKHSIILPRLMRGCHGMTGGSTEGFNLSVAENALVNAEGQDTTILAGAGAGIAIRMRELGLADGAFFPNNPGLGATFREALTEIVRTRESTPGALFEKRRSLVENLRSRADSVLTGGEELLDRTQR